MLVNRTFKKSALSNSMHAIIQWRHSRQLCLSIFLSLVAQQGFSQNPPAVAEPASDPVASADMKQEIRDLALSQGKDTSEEL